MTIQHAAIPTASISPALVAAALDCLAFIPDGQEKLRAPDFTFGRQVGDHAGKTNAVTGETLSAEDYAAHRAASLPSDADKALLQKIQTNPDGPWIAPRKAEALKQ